MRAYCLEEQRQAADAVAGYGGPIRAQCESDWGNDFHMVLFCIKEQQRLSQAAVADAQHNEQAARCAREWPNALDPQARCPEERHADSAAN